MLRNRIEIDKTHPLLLDAIMNGYTEVEQQVRCDQYKALSLSSNRLPLCLLIGFIIKPLRLHAQGLQRLEKALSPLAPGFYIRFIYSAPWIMCPVYQ